MTTRGKANHIISFEVAVLIVEHIQKIVLHSIISNGRVIAIDVLIAGGLFWFFILHG